MEVFGLLRLVLKRVFGNLLVQLSYITQKVKFEFLFEELLNR